MKMSINPSFTNILSASDAQERHQLTYQYLSLLQANAIEEKDSGIILQWWTWIGDEV